MRVGKNVEDREPSDTVAEMVKWGLNYAKEHGGFPNTETRLSPSPAILLLGINQQETNKNINSKRYMPSCVPRSIFTITLEVFINRLMDKEAACGHSGTYYSAAQKNQPVICSNANGPSHIHRDKYQVISLTCGK